MQLLDVGQERGERITAFDAVDVWSVLGAQGRGVTRIYTLYFEPGGRIGRHPTGRGQLFLVAEGSGWVEGEDGRRVPIRAGQAAYFARGEQHAKGSDAGMTAVMVQVEDLEPAAPEAAPRDSSGPPG